MSPPDCLSADPVSCDHGTPSLSLTLSCTKCRLSIEGEYVRALDGAFHWECFTCLDCSEPVATRFFPLELKEGAVQQPLCERDYFRRLNLVCESCGDALRGAYIIAVGKKFHLEHFCCSACAVVFGPEDSYYEHDNNVYCHYHYSIKFATHCSGCETAILKQFVEISRNNINEHWHPECYMIHKFWNVRVAQDSEESTGGHQDRDVTKMTIEELRESQVGMEDKVYRIWTVLSAFEESAAACISDMLVHVSEGSYVDGLRMADYFVIHVEVLFSAIDDLVSQYQSRFIPEIQHERESRMLCKKIINFFTLLSQTQETGLRRMGITEELLSLVTGLAHFLKVLIRISLTAALKLENNLGPKSAVISRFLSQLVELANKERYTSTDLDLPLATDLCQLCDTVCDDQCFRLMHLRWHDRCFACSKCCLPLRDEYYAASWDSKHQALLCKHCAASEDNTLQQGIERISQLQQFSYLLRFSHRRLYNLLGVQAPIESVLIPAAPTASSSASTAAAAAAAAAAAVTTSTTTIAAGNSDQARNEHRAINLGDIKRMKSTQMRRKLTDSQRVAKRSTLMETPSPNQAYVANNNSTTCAEINGNDTERMNLPTPSTSGVSSSTVQSSLSPSKYSKMAPAAKATYIAELSALDHFMVRHIAVLYLEELLKDHFDLEDLVDLIDDKKNSTLWGKFVTSLKTGGNKKSKEGTFGVPLEILVEKSGIESSFGASASRIRIPSFIDDCISAMKQMDMSVEGIFRKNGNIRRLKEIGDELDSNPNGVQLSGEGPVQIAALTKKFLRELPEPLLTFKLYKLFTVVYKIDSEEDRKRVLHLACCLLPKPNRDTMEVLFLFLKWVATFAEAEVRNGGSKMDLMNLATVLAPNILYSKNKDQVMDDSMAAIDAIYILLKYQQEFCTVPDDIVRPLKSLSYGEDDMEANVRVILRKCEAAMRLRRSRLAQFPSMLPRQHSSPAAIITVAPEHPLPPHNDDVICSPADMESLQTISPTMPLPISTTVPH